MWSLLPKNTGFDEIVPVVERVKQKLVGHYSADTGVAESN